MINIAICDDERAEVTYLSTLVRQWATARGVAVRLSDYESAESFLFAYEDDKAVDILLLDIQMGGIDGVALAKRIRTENRELQIIFITGYMEYIADGYDVEALNYLLKPVTDAKFNATLDRAMEKLARNEHALLLSHAGENTRVPLYEIRYLEVWHNYVTVHANANYQVKKTLGDLEKELDDNFFRLGRSYIVNLRYIRKTTKTEVHLLDATVIPLPRGQYESLNRAMIARL